MSDPELHISTLDRLQWSLSNIVDGIRAPFGLASERWTKLQSIREAQ